MNTEKTPETLQEVMELCADKENAENLFIGRRWKAGIRCPHCVNVDVTEIERKTRKQTRRIWKCNNPTCRQQFSSKTGTIFEDSPLGYDKWLPAVWLIVNAKNGISSHELARSIGVTQKTAWHMNHRIREALRQGSFNKMDGPTEADETYVGGLEKNKHTDKRIKAGRGGVGKTIVMGFLQRKSRRNRLSKVRAGIIPNTTTLTLHGAVQKHVAPGAVVYTDAHSGYRLLPQQYQHFFVDHAIGYAVGHVHTNSMENFWSLLKRTVKGTYVQVSPEHLTRYVDEQAWRFNQRGLTDGRRFLDALGSVGGKRLMYSALLESQVAE